MSVNLKSRSQSVISSHAPGMVRLATGQPFYLLENTMNTLTLPTKQHDFLHLEHVAAASEQHMRVILRDTFQAILDDSDGTEALLSYYSRGEHSSLGLNVACAIHDAKERYAREHADELEDEEMGATA